MKEDVSTFFVEKYPAAGQVVADFHRRDALLFEPGKRHVLEHIHQVVRLRCLPEMREIGVLSVASA